MLASREKVTLRDQDKLLSGSNKEQSGFSLMQGWCDVSTVADVKPKGAHSLAVASKLVSSPRSMEDDLPPANATGSGTGKARTVRQTMRNNDSASCVMVTRVLAERRSDHRCSLA